MVESIYKSLGRERRQLQKSGEIPEWFTTISWQMFKEKFQYKNQTVKETYTRIAKEAAKYTDDPATWEDKFFQLMWKGWLACSTPVLANMGTERGCSVSCSGGYVGDNVYEFYASQQESAVLSQQGFGTSAYLGDVRERGAKISRGGFASGIVPVLKGHVQVARDISQGGVRRGAWAGYVPIDHPDFWECAEYIKNNPDDCNIGWNVPQSFIDKLENSGTDALARYQRAMKIKMLTGKGYFFKVDTVNAQNPPMYKELGLSVKASNLCVAPETLILTDQGYVKISSLENKSAFVWNGEEFSNTTIKKTGVGEKLITVTTSSAMEVDCTPYHKFYIVGEYHQKPREVRATDLKPGDKLIKSDYPVIDGTLELEKPYTNGFFSGDGCYHKGRNIVYLYGDKKKLFHAIENEGPVSVQEAQDRIVFSNVTGLQHKFFVPLDGYSVQSKLQWLAGLLDSDGTVARNGDNEAFQIGSVNYQFLKDTQLMLQTLGVSSKVTMCREAGMNLMPANNGSGESKEYATQTIYRLLISSSGLFVLASIGLHTRRLEWGVRQPQRNAEQFNTVVSVEDKGRIDDTYCFTEPKRHMGVFNGILAGNCSEITLHSDEDHTFSCVLSSINLAKYDEWKDTDAVFNATVFLDCVAADLITKGKEIRGLEKVVRFTEKSRALGLGALGFHTYLQDNSIPIESMEAHYKNVEMFKSIQAKAKESSKWMAEHWGEPEWCKGYGVRNTHLLAVAPNTTSALICGSVSQGIEPVYKNAYVQGSAAGEMNRVNPSLVKVMKEKGVYNDETITRIIDNKGSIQEEHWATDHEKLVFKTAFEIEQKALLRLASARQRYICQAQSLNLFFSADEDEAYISEVHKEALLDPWIKSLYYLRSESGVKASKECEACSG